MCFVILKINNNVLKDSLLQLQIFSLTSVYFCLPPAPSPPPLPTSKHSGQKTQFCALKWGSEYQTSQKFKQGKKSLDWWMVRILNFVQNSNFLFNSASIAQLLVPQLWEPELHFLKPAGSFFFQVPNYSYLLYISTSVRVLHTPNTDRNSHFQRFWR